MQYRDVIDKVLPRAKRLGLVDEASGMVDAVEAETALLTYVQRLVVQHDLDAFTVINENMATTTPNTRDYALPEDFGRLLQPNDRDEHGLFVHDGSNIYRLTYRTPDELLRLQATSTNRPSHFTIVGRLLRLDPAPDANSGSDYTIRGTYIAEIASIDLDTDVPIPVANAEEGTMAELAVNAAHQNADVFLRRSAAYDISLVAQQRRMKQPFQRRAQWSRNTGIRR